MDCNSTRKSATRNIKFSRSLKKLIISSKEVGMFLVLHLLQTSCIVRAMYVCSMYYSEECTFL